MAMETAVATAVVGRIAPKLLLFLGQNQELRRNLERDIDCIKKEFDMISAAIKEDEDRRRWRSGGGDDHVQRTWIEQVRELAHAIEDCIDRYIHRVTIKDDADASFIRRNVHRARTMKARNKFAAEIRELKRRSKEASNLRDQYKTADSSSSAASSSSRVVDEDEEYSRPLSAGQIVGMDASVDELMEMMTREETCNTSKRLKVISIVGFDGIGKTLLARQVYNSVEQYEPQVWVRAADRDGMDVVREILRQIRGVPVPTHAAATRSNCLSELRECLGTKRFFIVIDDMRTVFWHDIKDAFPGDESVSSRIMVTTAIRSVANACSSAHGHVYVMRTLAEQHSRQLFFKELVSSDEEDPPPDTQTQMGSEALKICDGLPLALVTTARFLQSQGDPRKWSNLCVNLSVYLEKERTLARMKRVLVHSYTSLPSQVAKTCLLYLGSIYPSGRQVRRGSLIRRWLAEGFIRDDEHSRRSALDVAIDNFEVLLRRSILQPIDVSNNAEVKTCQAHGMMLEFILHKSMCENFVTLLCGKALPPTTSNSASICRRWLSLHHASAPADPIILHLVRSLTVLGNAHKSFLRFSKYELLRVLDLEECRNPLGEKDLKKICSSLLLLRYLSLGASVTVTVLPKEMKKLVLLETLDLRKTKTEMILPAEIMKLPCLIHLLGKFKLQDVGVRKMHKLQSFLSNKSKLETLAGLVADNNSGFPQLMEHMEHLTKVKIYTTTSSSNLTRLSKAIEGFVKRSTDVKEAPSISLNFKEDLLDFSLEESCWCYLSTLKLKANKIHRLPPFVNALGGLTELCLSSYHQQLSGHILAALSQVRGLQYLKLIATHLDDIVIGPRALGSLLRLCIVVESMAKLDIREGALPRLESLRLLCKDLNGFSGAAQRIHSLGRLREVALDDGLSDLTKHEWKQAAKEHPRRPSVLFVAVKMKKEYESTAAPPANNDDASSVIRLQDAISTTGQLQLCPPVQVSTC